MTPSEELRAPAPPRAPDGPAPARAAGADAARPRRLDALLVYVEAAAYPWQISRRTQLGLYYLAQHAADAGFEVGVDNVSANDHVVRRLLRLLDERSCTLLGCYVDQDNLWDVRRVLRGVRARRPEVRVVVGGPQVTADPEGTLERIEDAACAAIGEGEETFVELLSLPSFEAELLDACAGIAYRSPGGAVVRTSPRPPLAELDRLSIPRRRRFTVDDAEKPQPLMIAGRGCTGRCAFCYESRRPHDGKRLRLHSAERCFEEFAYLAEECPEHYVCILDDTFVADPRRAREFCRRVAGRFGDSVKWFCEARVDTLARDRDLLPRMVEAGLLRLQVGGESGSQRVLDAYRKDIRLEQLWTAVEDARKAGLLSLFANFIVGGAFETLETYEATEKLAVELLRAAPGCVAVGKSYFTPYAGTPMAERPADFGLTIVDREGVTGQGDHHVVCRTEALSRMEILELGCRFEKTVDATMRRLGADLPRAAVYRHFEANHRWSLDTEWYSALCEDMAVYGYFTSLANGSALSFADARARGFAGTHPFRTFDLGPSRGTRHLVRTRGDSVRELDELEGALVELSSGKLPQDELLDTLCAAKPGVDGAALRGAALGRLESLDEDHLVVWRMNVE